MFLNGDILLYHCGWSCPTTKGHQNQLSKKNQLIKGEKILRRYDMDTAEQSIKMMKFWGWKKKNKLRLV